MKKRSLITSVCAGALLTALSASTALAEIVYVTATCSNVTSSTVCGSSINPDFNETTWYNIYLENVSGAYTTARATTPDKPATGGARYWTTGWSNTTPDLAVIISPSLAVTGGVYRLYHVYSSTAANVSQDSIVGATNIENCTLSFTQTDKFQRKYGSPAPQKWQLLGFVTNAPDSSNPRIGFYHAGGTVNGSNNRMLIDTFRFVLDEPCLATETVGVTGPLLAGGTNVTVTLATNATKLTVYQDSGSGFKPVGSLSEGIVNGFNSVPVTGLVKGGVVGATQTVNGQESCVPTAGMIVGGGPNPRVRIALSVREAVNATGPVGADGRAYTTNAARIHYLGASEIMSGSAPIDGTVVLPMNTWQTVTFQRGPDYLNPTNPSVIWNSNNTGDAGKVNDLQGEWATLEAIAFVLDDTTDTGPYRIYIDNIVNGGITNDPIVIEDFEDAPAKMSDYTFHPPGASGSTGGNLLSQPNEGVVDNTVADTGAKSMRIVWQWSSLKTNNWIRFNTSNSTQGKPNPMFNLNDPVSFRILIQPVGAPAPTPPAVPRPTVIMSKAGETNVFEWTGAHRLQTAATLDGPFTNLPQVIIAPNTNTFKGPYTNVTSDPVRFYRLVD